MKTHPFVVAGLTVLERGWLSSNNVYFAGHSGTGSALVDSGYCAHSTQTVELVRRVLGRDILEKVVNTHLHSDHCGGNAALQAAFQCAVDIPMDDAAKVDAWAQDDLSYRATGQDCPRFVRRDLLADGDVLSLGRHPWEAIATPGHDDSSLVFYQPDLKLLISADALWENGFGVVFGELTGKRAFEKVRQTLDRLEKLDVDWIIPGHGRPFQGLGRAIERAHRRLEAFEKDPRRHAQYAAKVLVKFRLLEVQSVSLEDMESWIRSTEYFQLIHRTYFSALPFAAWWRGLVEDLKTAGAVTVDDGLVRNA